MIFPWQSTNRTNDMGNAFEFWNKIRKYAHNIKHNFNSANDFIIYR
jgi:hypothetical protein